MEVSGQFQALTTLPWGESSTIPIELEGSVVHGVGLDRLEKRTPFCLHQESNYKLHTLFLL